MLSAVILNVDMLGVVALVYDLYAISTSNASITFEISYTVSVKKIYGWTTRVRLYQCFIDYANAADQAYLNMKNTYCLFQIKFITEYINVQHIIITQI